eukprot:3571353-Rhodomonas_salina.9
MSFLSFFFLLAFDFAQNGHRRPGEDFLARTCSQNWCNAIRYLSTGHRVAMIPPYAISVPDIA